MIWSNLIYQIVSLNEKGKIAIKSAEKELNIDEDSDSESGEVAIEHLTRQKLISKIEKLQKRLDYEKAKQRMYDGMFIYLVIFIGFFDFFLF